MPKRNHHTESLERPKKALGLADKLGARYAILIGENEIAAGKFTLKRLADAAQTSVTEVELLEALKAS